MKIFMIIGPILVLILIFWILHAFRIVKLFKEKETDALNSLCDLEEILKQRYELLVKLIDIALGYANYKKYIVRQTIRFHEGMTIEELTEADHTIDDMSKQLYAAADQYPEFCSSEIYCEISRRLQVIETRLQAGKQIYNITVKSYNRIAEKFPVCLIAREHQIPKKLFGSEECKSTKGKNYVKDKKNKGGVSF